MPSHRHSDYAPTHADRLAPRAGIALAALLVSFAALLVSFAAAIGWANENGDLDGREIYRQKCAACHGPQGEGVADKYDEALYGNRPLAELIDVIDETMPEENPEQCTGDDAEAVGRYIYETFYTAAARAKNQAPRIELARLTARQYENAVADLVGSFIGERKISDARGLKADYYNDRKFNGREKKMSRVDPRVDFHFGETSPHEELRDSEFSIRWRGSVIVHETGDYEFGVKTENGFQLWVNDMDEPLIDGYVAAGPQPTRRDGAIRLLAGRAYPLKLEWFKYKDKTASVQLMWKPPHKAWQVIPQRHLAPEEAQPTLVITTPFPPDDSSLGYPRGTSVSQAWDEATTYAAVEVANRVVQHLSRLAGAGKNAPDRREKLEAFCAKFAERAFRRPLSEDERRLYVASHFADSRMSDAGDARKTGDSRENSSSDDAYERAVKRSIVMALKSPYFLYPGLPHGDVPEDYAVASRLSFALWDSLPDQSLWQAAARNELHTREQIAAHARRMADDPRAKAKLRGFFAHWLQLDHTEHLAKDDEKFAGYDDALISDLRTSLELFIEDVIDSDAADYRRLLLADYWYVNDRLAEFYGQKAPPDAGFHKVRLDGKDLAAQRCGVVTHPYMLASLSYFETTSPIHRGVFAARRLLNRPLMPPPNAILFENAKFDPHLTMREKVAELTKAKDCQSCHGIINPLGFSLENFDAVGRYRTMEKDKPIDSVSDYTTSAGETIRLTSGRDLAEYAAASEQAQRGFVEQLFHHTVKQPAAAYGEDTLDRLHQTFVEKQYNMRELLVEIATLTTLNN